MFKKKTRCLNLFVALSCWPYRSDHRTLQVGEAPANPLDPQPLSRCITQPQVSCNRDMKTVKQRVKQRRIGIMVYLKLLHRSEPRKVSPVPAMLSG